MFNLHDCPAHLRSYLHRCTRALLVAALLAGLSVAAGALGVHSATSVLAQMAQCTEAADGTIICPSSSSSTGGGSQFSNCFTGQSGVSCTTYNPGGPPTVSNCIEAPTGFSCTNSTPGSAPSVSNCLTSGSSYSCSITSPGAAPQAANCLTNGNYYSCTNYSGGSPSSASNCVTDGVGTYSCTTAPTAGASSQPAATATGQYCTDASGGQVWVPQGAPSTGLTCGSGAGTSDSGSGS